MQLLLENENAEDTANANVLLRDLAVLLPACELDKAKRKSPSFFSFLFSEKIKIS